MSKEILRPQTPKTPPAAQPAPVTYCEIHHLPEPCVQCAKEHEGYNTTPPAAQPAPVPLAHIIGEIDHMGKVWTPAAPQRKPLTFNEITAIEEKVYMQTTHKGKPAFEYAHALIRAVEAAHNIKEKNT